MIASFLTPEWIVAPMRQLLATFMTWTGSYGLAIILLTISVRLLILPLTIYQTRSMKKVQELQPKMKEMQEKFKDQPEQLNKGMMQLYKENGANPLAGCLPLVIQMPFLYAIFAVLRSFDPTVAPYHASPVFVGLNLFGHVWLNLQLADPLYILPLLSVASMFLQSWLSGVGNDPNQKMMMYMMPLVFGWITFKMPSGVVLYWVISTVFGLVQQAIYPGFPRLKGAPDTKGAAGAR